MLILALAGSLVVAACGTDQSPDPSAASQTPEVGSVQTDDCQAQPGFGINTPGLRAGRDFVSAQFLIGLCRWGPAGAPHAVILPPGARIAREIHGIALLVEFPDEAAALAAIPTLLRTPNIRYVERNGIASIN